MKLVIGGAYQGKTEYAREHFPEMDIVKDFHLLVLETIKIGDNPMELLKNCADKVIVCDDIFCGVVPVDPLTRKWREELGRVLAAAAKESDEVVRVFCGLGTRLK
jgi:adenosylcobinamide kinase/adenosylcobinamide-phosphate guanylyltransferase